MDFYNKLEVGFGGMEELKYFVEWLYLLYVFV